jgi:hypothetical protein
MCIGRPQAHIQAEAQREADRQSAQFEESLRAAEQRNADVIAAMKPKYTPPPSGTGAAMEDNQGVQRKKTRKSSIVDANRGVSSLRIPLNTGGMNGAGPNLG